MGQKIVTTEMLGNLLDKLLDQDTTNVLATILLPCIEEFGPEGDFEHDELYATLGYQNSTPELRLLLASFAKNLDATMWGEIIHKSEIKSDDSALDAVAGNRTLPIAMQRHIVQKHPQHLDRVLERTADYELLLIEHDESDDLNVRAAIAQNKHTPGWVLSLLARDEHPSVRSRIANNRNSSKATLEMLNDDVVDAVKRLANKRLEERKG